MFRRENFLSDFVGVFLLTKQRKTKSTLRKEPKTNMYNQVNSKAKANYMKLQHFPLYLFPISSFWISNVFPVISRWHSNGANKVFPCEICLYLVQLYKCQGHFPCFLTSVDPRLRVKNGPMAMPSARETSVRSPSTLSQELFFLLFSRISEQLKFLCSC